MPKFSMSVYQDAAAEHKHPVELCGVELSRVTLHSSRLLPVGSKVRFHYGQRSARGVVKTCEPFHSRFLLEVQVVNASDWLSDLTNAKHHFDPGPMILDKFMSADQLSQILAGMGGNSHFG